jgi:hypothetical protein
MQFFSKKQSLFKFKSNGILLFSIIFVSGNLFLTEIEAKGGSARVSSGTASAKYSNEKNIYDDDDDDDDDDKNPRELTNSESIIMLLKKANIDQYFRDKNKLTIQNTES